ncbi:ATPase, T2SS/T4P/T4SS family [Clostridioides difficile]|nr:Flp pilus assembly complex ATPase component TadA [Clostridioides difficile]MCL6901979.1 Flp pilus assembly complex ATPase component TadA [Clostridioides difficile]MCP3377841.1 Flp pilus assembly complex ATPase component TadA [Clostridioides difficile]MDE3493471.1 ATPase, T2SS/T4P/T4SS family [Clostridioides difficile]MDE3707878.1 ATPase, T2SS/T4P/T4SS family [Clostridioides difficile]
MNIHNNSLHKKFLKETNKKDFYEILKSVQEYITKKYPGVWNYEENIIKEELKPYVMKYIDDYSLSVEGLNQEELTERIISEMAGFSFLDKYIYRENKDLEEININQFNSTRITYSNGDKEFIKESFDSPEHAEIVLKRLFRKSNIVFDRSQPLVRGHLENNIRITALGMGVVDEDKGPAVSIRIINPRNLTQEDFITSETASKEMLYVVTNIFKYGGSICITGPTNSGKTTTLIVITEGSVSNNDRLITIEEGVREFDLVKRDSNGNIINEVIHLSTKYSNDPKKNIDQEKLLEFSLTMHPDFFVISEMKGKEAFEAQKAANTGHPFMTTIHANSCDDTYPRMVDLCKSKSNMDDKTLYDNVTRAFPIVIFQKQLKDKTRKIMEIKECVVSEDGKRKMITLFRFKMKGETIINGKKKILGDFIKVENISESLQRRLSENGMPDEVLEKILGKW